VKFGTMAGLAVLTVANAAQAQVPGEDAFCADLRRIVAAALYDLGAPAAALAIRCHGPGLGSGSCRGSVARSAERGRQPVQNYGVEN
jgi:hypothetical protein